MAEDDDRLGVPSARMSVGWRVRPITGGTPRKLKALPDSRTPPKLSGENSPVSSTGSIDVAITSEKAGSAAISPHLRGM